LNASPSTQYGHRVASIVVWPYSVLTRARLDRQSKMSKKKGAIGGPIDPVVGGMIPFQAEERFTARNRCRFARNRRFHFCEFDKQFLDLALLVRAGNVFEFHVLIVSLEGWRCVLLRAHYKISTESAELRCN